jgi:syndecan 1
MRRPEPAWPAPILLVCADSAMSWWRCDACGSAAVDFLGCAPRELHCTASAKAAPRCHCSGQKPVRRPVGGCCGSCYSGCGAAAAAAGGGGRGGDNGGDGAGRWQRQGRGLPSLSPLACRRPAPQQSPSATVTASSFEWDPAAEMEAGGRETETLRRRQRSSQQSNDHPAERAGAVAGGGGGGRQAVAAAWAAAAALLCTTAAGHGHGAETLRVGGGLSIIIES